MCYLKEIPKELLVTRFSHPQRDVALAFSACMNCIVTWFVYAAFLMVATLILCSPITLMLITLLKCLLPSFVAVIIFACDF